MDVQGTCFHLLNGLADWQGCVDPATGSTLAEEWASELSDPAGGLQGSLEYDDALSALRLRHDLPLFHRASRITPLQPEARRGAGRDSYGNWFWISDDETSITWFPVDDTQAVTWWSTDDLTATCRDGQPSGFEPVQTPPPSDARLCGLAVTTAHYLAVGYIAEAEQGILLFDLQAGGAPSVMVWPAPFAPFDLADSPDGGVLILDRDNGSYYQLDRYFRLRGPSQSTAGPFFEEKEGRRETRAGPAIPTPSPLYAGSPLGGIEAVSIEPGPVAGTVLILESDSSNGYSVVHLFGAEGPLWSSSLAGVIEVIDLSDPTDTPERYSLLGQDFAYVVDPPGTGPLPPPMLYIADAEGKQVVAFTVDASTGILDPQSDYLPMRGWDGKALVRAGPGPWYDFGDRWIPLEEFTECTFAPSGAFLTPAEFNPVTPGQPFDSQIPGCIWHRLFLDAQVPSGTYLTVQARGADDPGLLAQTPWTPQPAPYLRSDGAELAWYDPWKDQRNSDGSLPPGTGTWELLFQQVSGRYVQVLVMLNAGGHTSPAIRSLRAWFPRFSYAQEYLPAVYLQDAAPRRFLERFLANFEGFYTVTEERIEHSSLLLDARTAPLDDLAWLACWFGLVLDPLWNEVQQRFMIRNVDRFYRSRGTLGGLLAALRVYFDPDVDDSVFDCSCTSVGGLRIVERFLTRDAGGAAYGDPNATAGSGTEADRVAAAAHRFDVLVPAGLSSQDLDMINRILAFNQPAHTASNVSTYFDVFVVGQARLGIDTQLGSGLSFAPMIVGQGALAATYLGFPHPFELADRIVSDRDRVGDMSPL